MDYSLVYRNLPLYSGQLGFFSAGLCYLSYYDQLRQVENLRRGLLANEISFAPLQNDYVSRALIVRTSAGYSVAIEGTTTGTQWLGYLVNAGVAEISGIPGRVFTPFRDIGLSIALRVQSQVDPSYPIFLTGHSLGGAAACVAARILQHRGFNVTGVVTFGSPKFCDSQFADNYHVPTHRVYHRNDPIPFLPPNWSSRLAALFPGAPELPVLRNVGRGTPVYDPSERPSFFDALYFMERYAIRAVLPAFNRHLVGNYCRFIWRELPREVQRQFFTIYAALHRQGLTLPYR